MRDLYFLSIRAKNGIKNHTFFEAALRCTNLLFPPSNENSDSDNGQLEGGSENNNSEYPEPDDSMWDELELSQDSQFDNDYRDPVTDAIEHIKRKNNEERTERFEDLGLNVDDYEGLGDILDDTYSNPLEVWTRPGEKNETKAYVNRDGKTVFIDNPKKPTIFPPTLGAEEYLIKEQFTKDK